MDVDAELGRVEAGDVLEVRMRCRAPFDPANSNNGDVFCNLQVDELVTISTTMGDLDRLKKWLFRMSTTEGGGSSSAALKPQLRAWSEKIQVPEPVVAILTNAFDEQRRLSSAKFPQLAELRNKEATLYRRIKSMVETLLATTLKGDMPRRGGSRGSRVDARPPKGSTARLSLYR